MSTADSPSFTEGPAQPSTPSVVRTSALLYVIGAIIGLIGAIIVLVALPGQLSAAQGQIDSALQGRNTNGVDVAGITTGTAIGIAVFSTLLTLAFSILTIVFAQKMKQGRNWARIVLAVFTFLQLFGVLGSYGVGALHFLVLLVAFILSVLPTANVWFREQKALRTPTV
ncbi:hypothetical protein [Amnibacterium sp.]|uniref:hypothetical protein n=1 Tax=Amnibacterium sp. TaxID=1872496 RepID=UPI003F7C0E6E